MITLRFVKLVFCSFLWLSAVADAEPETPLTVSAQLYKKLQETDRLIADKAYTKAIQRLKILLTEVKSDSYEAAAVLRSLSSVYALQESYKQAADYLGKALALKVLPEQQQQQALLNLGQLYLASGQYAKAIQILKPWLAQNSNPGADMHAMIANAYSQLKQYRNALSHIEQALRQTKKPAEAWHQLQLALYYELKDYQAAAGVLQQLMRRYPDKKDYWQQLSVIYQQAKEYKRAATIKHLLYKRGMLTSEKEIMELVNLYLYVGAPYKAAALLKKEIAAKRLMPDSQYWVLLANAWMQAREFNQAVEALKTAVGLNDKGELWQQLGGIYFEQENWQGAITALTKALAKGGLTDPGNAYLMLGMSYFENKNKDQARKAFVQAAKYTKSRKTADQWLSYVAR